MAKTVFTNQHGNDFEIECDQTVDNRWICFVRPIDPGIGPGDFVRAPTAHSPRGPIQVFDTEAEARTAGEDDARSLYGPLKSTP